MNNIIHESFKHGENFKIGHFCIIEENVVVGNNVEIGNYVVLKKGTIIGNNCFMDSYTISSGQCKIGNNVKIRYQSIIARNVVVEDDVYITAGVKTIFLDHTRNKVQKQLVIGKGSFLGDNVTVLGGVKIAPNCVIGANALVTRNTEPNGVYIGTPAKRLRDLREGEI